MSGMLRRTDELGRIVLPKEMRDRAGAVIGSYFDISLEGKTFTLILQENEEQKCSGCGNVEKEYAEFGKIQLCENCVDDVIEKSLK